MSQADLRYEKELWRKGISVVAGADEVGRGCFSGPVAAGCVVFPPTFKGGSLQGIRVDDSKKLTAKQREVADKWIKKNALGWGVGEASAALINRIGIVAATQMAFRRAIANTNLKLKAKGLKNIDFLLVDAFYLPYVRGLRRKNQLAIVNGDEKSFSIAAASIVAKVYRDKLMQSLSKKFPKYGWVRNKGYGTREHRETILAHGMTKYHRKQFVETFLNKSQL